METTEGAPKPSISSTVGYRNQSAASAGLYGAFGLLIFCLNLMCAFAILKEKLHREQNRFFFMASLAVADALLGLSLIVQTTMELLNVYPACYNAGNTVLGTAIAADVLCLCLLTSDQFLRIILHMRYPVYASFRNACRALCAVGLICVGYTALSTAMLLEGQGRCTYYDGYAVFVYPQWYQVYEIVVFFVLPLLTIVSMHAWIMRISRRQLRRLDALVSTASRSGERKTGGGGTEQQPPPCGASCEGCHQCPEEQLSQVHGVCPCGHNNRFQARHQWRAVVTITVLVGVLLCTWVPVHVFIVLQVFWPELYPCADCSTTETLAQLTSYVYFLNPLLNPFIYTVRVPEVKKQMWKMLRR